MAVRRGETKGREPGALPYHLAMIVRVLTATVRTEQAAAFNAKLREQLLLLREQPGLVYVKLARQVGPTHEEVVLFEEWRDTAALYAWAGPVITRPRLLPGTEGLVDELKVAHYEALDVDPDAVPGAESP
jgi:antibiotic biosynthesis monooxygenase (ABM) superfamily enzyme